MVILPILKPRSGYNAHMKKLDCFRSRHYIVLMGLLAALSMLPACGARRSASGQEVWAEVDDQPIYREQVERIYRGRTAQGTEAVTPEEAASFKLNVLGELINNQILVMHASHSRITASEAEIDARIAGTEKSLFPGGVSEEAAGAGARYGRLTQGSPRKPYLD